MVLTLRSCQRDERMKCWNAAIMTGNLSGVGLGVPLPNCRRCPQGSRISLVLDVRDGFNYAVVAFRVDRALLAVLEGDLRIYLRWEAS